MHLGKLTESIAFNNCASTKKNADGKSNWDELKVSAKWPSEVQNKTTLDICRAAVCRDLQTFTAVVKLVRAHRDAKLPSRKIDMATELIKNAFVRLKDEVAFVKYVEGLTELKVR